MVSKEPSIDNLQWMYEQGFLSDEGKDYWVDKMRKENKKYTGGL